MKHETCNTQLHMNLWSNSRFLFYLILALFWGTGNAAAHREAIATMQFGGKGESAGRFGETTYWDFDAEGNMFVSDADNRRIQKLSPRGQWLLTIDGREEDSPFRLRNPSDIAVDGQGNIYVADWTFTRIEGYESPPLYDYAPCVHQFDPDGSWKRTFPLEPPQEHAQFLDRAVPGLDADGNSILILPQGDTERGFRLTATEEGELFALDGGKLYQFNASGERVGKVTSEGLSPAWFYQVTDIVARDRSQIYLLDPLRHRIVVIDSLGDVQQTIGRYGDQDGQFESPSHLAVLRDGNILVADKAYYDRFIDSALTRHDNDPSSRSLYESVGGRRLRSRLYRVQRFNQAGQFLEKILLRLDREDPYERELQWLTLNQNEQLYLQHPDTLMIEQYTPASTFNVDALRTEFSLHYELNEFNIEIDNPEDLDVDRDFDETLRIQLVSADLRFRYDYNERLQVSLLHNGLYFYAKQEDFYAQDFEDIARGAFNQSDKTLEDYLAGLMRLGFDWVLNDEPYDYRTAGLSLYLGGGRYSLINDALDITNQRYLSWDLWFSEWGGGFHYDVARRWQIDLGISRGPAYNFFNYEFDYIDELGVLFATGFREGTQTQVLFSINGVF